MKITEELLILQSSILFSLWHIFPREILWLERFGVFLKKVIQVILGIVTSPIVWGLSFMTYNTFKLAEIYGMIEWFTFLIFLVLMILLSMLYLLIYGKDFKEIKK